MNEKPCNICHIIKSADKFYPGYMHCIECAKKRKIKRNHTHISNERIDRAKINIEETDYIENAIDWLADMLAKEITNIAGVKF